MSGAAAPRQFTGAEKAGVILMALGGEQGARILQALDPEELKRVITGVGGIGSIERADLEALIGEFAERFARLTGLVGDSGKFRAILESAFPGGALDNLLEGPREAPHVPIWESLPNGAENTLAPLLLDEHPQTAAYVLSKLQSGVTARILALMPQALRVSVTARLLRLGECHPEAARLIEQSLRARLQTRKDPAADRRARSRVAAIINEMERSESDGIMADLTASLPEDARALRSLLFSFEDVQKLDPKSRALLLDRAGADVLIPALFGCDAEMKEAVLSVLGARARRMAEAELAQNDAPVPATLPNRRRIVQMALALGEAGEIALPSPDTAPDSAAV